MKLTWITIATGVLLFFYYSGWADSKRESDKYVKQLLREKIILLKENISMRKELISQYK